MSYQRTYIVVFKPADKDAWWIRFLDKCFVHCFLATYIDDKNCLIIDPAEGDTKIYVLNKPVESMISEYLLKGYKIADYTVKDTAMVMPRLNFKTCVEVCKDFLGINKWWILTPKQLYREVSR